MKIKPLYKWAGGKNKMIPKYLETPTIPLSGYDTYVEPFFGGGAMMLYVYENNPDVKKFILNDINEEIVNLYTSIKTDVKTFLKTLDGLQQEYIPLSKEGRKEYYYKIRKEYGTDYSKWNKVVEAAHLYFLMRTSFNGIWQATKESKGRFATPCGLLNETFFVYDKENVYEWNKLLQKVDIYCGDWKGCVDKVEGTAFYFMDPPYRDSFTAYGQVFGDDKQVELMKYCSNVSTKHKVMFCGRDTGDTFYTDNQGKLQLHKYEVTYTAGRRKKQDNGTHTAKDAVEILLHNI